MTTKLRAPSYLYAIFFISILFQFGLNAHNFSNLIIDAQASNQGGVNQTQISIQQVNYIFSPNDPTHLSGIVVSISSTQMDHTQLEVSLDEGASWHACRSASSSTWTCNFVPGSEPQVASIKNIQIRDQKS
jgi:hypothetical protein